MISQRIKDKVRHQRRQWSSHDSMLLFIYIQQRISSFRSLHYGFPFYILFGMTCSCKFMCDVTIQPNKGD